MAPTSALPKFQSEAGFPCGPGNSIHCFGLVEQAQCLAYCFIHESSSLLHSSLSRLFPSHLQEGTTSISYFLGNTESEIMGANPGLGIVTTGSCSSKRTPSTGGLRRRDKPYSSINDSEPSTSISLPHDSILEYRTFYIYVKQTHCSPLTPLPHPIDPFSLHPP
ncbi:hypothetical protein M413DRAFT_286799 [Hebeloma cylindrosporum]|uniref:Uncharacterized protein n=1 Tax=Hebeloma cylindrosporum TaxID=76867 RepID=A0A0C2Y6M1_HEBCY|nr:hypothetical protein M413DRAFT_286799 [Hebeloma cylindrosporum h7]